MDSIAPAIASAVIATMFFGYLIVRMALQFEEKRLAMKAGKTGHVEQVLAETQAEMARMRDRVQVLERLATDEDRRLAGEISRLGSGADAQR